MGSSKKNNKKRGLCGRNLHKNGFYLNKMEKIGTKKV